MNSEGRGTTTTRNRDRTRKKGEKRKEEHRKLGKSISHRNRDMHQIGYPFLSLLTDAPSEKLRIRF